MNCQKANIYISGKLDGELTVEQERELDIHLDSCPFCRKEYDELLKIKEVTNDMRFSELPDRYWAGYWNGIYNRLERGIGWIFLSVGLIIILCFGAWELFDKFFLDDSVSAILKLGIGAGIIGAITLLVSVFRQKLFARRHERYKEVER
ncbi:MAG: zf-HC2 domain-containing protein [candidate division Zixibacteria bacterium]|nr:zf-HC2 domain-containing protein [candidate division Zixibacteria bacterium]